MVYEHVDAYHTEKVELNVKKIFVIKVALQYKITLTVLIPQSYRRRKG
jgi:hypothetical protein